MIETESLAYAILDRVKDAKDGTVSMNEAKATLSKLTDKPAFDVEQRIRKTLNDLFKVQK
ncbi:MAG: hypothetical protein M9949_04665 [Candidatus Kapabacteria bacterium]|nr:hypothetical protein [Candidatus Kapabacteria bacterium]